NESSKENSVIPMTALEQIKLTAQKCILLNKYKVKHDFYPQWFSQMKDTNILKCQNFLEFESFVKNNLIDIPKLFDLIKSNESEPKIDPKLVNVRFRGRFLLNSDHYKESTIFKQFQKENLSRVFLESEMDVRSIKDM